MATIIPGTGGTLKASTLEGAFHEALMRIAIAEQDPTKNIQALTCVTIHSNIRSSRITGTFAFRLIKQVSSTGSTQFVITEHLINTGYTTPTAGTIKSAGICGAFIEIAENILSKEQLTSKNPSSLHSIKELRYDPTALTVSGYFDYLTIETISPLGDLVISGKTYLLD